MSEATYGQVAQILREVNNLHGRIASVDASVDQVAGQVSTVASLQAETRNDLAQLRADFHTFVRQAELTANVQRAETRLGTLQGEVEHQFGHHKVVRRGATGMLQAFDVGIVSQETVQTVGEQLMLQTPRYWLAPALVALAAWSGDDQQLCAKATEEAFRRSPSRTSLFFALVLRRQKRNDGAVRWLRHYLEAQDPNALGREFAVILEAVAQGAFGPAGKQAITETLEKWGEVLSQSPEASEAQVTRWRNEVERYRGAASSGDFPRLSQVSPEWPALEKALVAAEGQQLLADHYAALLAAEAPVSTSIEDATDDILDRLVTEYDPEELPLRRELVKVQAIISNGGDMSEAERQADVDVVALDKTLDYLTIQSTAALQPADLGVSAATQKISIAACSGWFAQAHERATAAYRAGMPPQVTAALDDRHSIGAATFALPTWKGSFGTPLPELEADLSRHWDGHTKTFLDSLLFDLKKAALVPGIVTLVALIFLTAVARVVGVLIALVGGGIWALKINNDRKKAEANHQQAVSVLAKAKTESIAQLRAASAELYDWSARFAAADAHEAEVQRLIADFGTAGQSPTNFERRAVEV